ncbi:LRR domain containing protein [Trema orientale]|uniref:LRR domain containing protein n=1 Tax=Trema orientale TaxID=63057 RepID=A0A2P5C7J3_TREOI|nr:LRR domain containing protein [Trema orientale]
MMSSITYNLGLQHWLGSCFAKRLFEDYSISDERLYRLWIAEGFVKAEEHKTLEEVAKAYLNELMIWDEKKSRGKGRHLIISTSTENVETTGVRSILLFDIEDKLTESFMVTLSMKFRFLEVLDYQNALIDALPKELGNLCCLKYLSLRYTNVRVLPKSIGNLCNLQSLDIRDTLIDKLLIEINKLKNLRHLLAYRYNSSAANSMDFVHGVLMQEGFGQLEELQTLTLVEAHQSAVGLMKELEKLRKLRWLGITKLTREFGRALCAYIAKMDHLERLFVNSIDENEVLDLQYIPSNSLHFLRDLLLVGRLEKLPEWIQNLQNLQGLCLCLSRLSDIELSKCLQGLPNLVSLELLDQAYEGEQLQFEEGGFRKLKRLTLNRLYRLQLVKIDKGALPVLELLDITDCLLLNEMPSIHHLGSIKHVFVNGEPLH